MRTEKVVVVGLDGLEPTILEPMLSAGLLPNMAALFGRGTCGRIATTLPAQTPVAWSTFATGRNPGAHGIFDFLCRDPATYLPQLGLNRYEQKNPFVPPRVVNRRRGTTIWERLSSAGIPSVVLRCPCSYPPENVHGQVLSGMGVPDLRGSLGVSTFYSPRDGVVAGESESVVRLPSDPIGPIATEVLGPLDRKTHRPVTCPITIDAAQAEETVFVSCPATQDRVAVGLGRWSGWLRVKFKMGVFQSVAGMVRFHLVRCRPELELYASPVNFLPDGAPLPLSSPPEYAARLAEEIGPYYTTGMVEEHGGLENGRIDEAAFLDQCEQAWNEREAMLLHALSSQQEGFIFCLFDTPDRVQHMFWRFRDGAPGTNGSSPWRHVIEDQYRRCDALLGNVRPLIDDRTLLIALSDHGFGSFRRCVSLNTWLLENGLLCLQSGLRPGPEAGDMLRHVDWTRTKAYALGLGGIYLNRRGRERDGIVDEDEAAGLKAAIQRELPKLVDPDQGTRPVRRVSASEEAYRGEHVGDAPDLLVHFAAGYRTAWETALGGIPDFVVAENTRRWSGDHIVDPELVPGVLLTNRPFRPKGARLVDMAPTILDAFGVPCDAAWEGESLLT